MIVRLKDGADAAAVKRALAGAGLWASSLESLGGVPEGLLSIAAHSTAIAPELLLAIPGVASVASEPSPHPRLDAQPPCVTVAGVRLGRGAPPVVMAGPCSVESERQIFEIAARLSRQGARFLRGGAWKPRSSPYAFQGHGRSALEWLRRAADASGLKVVTEALAEHDVEAVAEHADLVQVGSRNMQNYALLCAIARTGRPVLLKRGMAATLEEWRLAGEYCLVHGASAVLFCERGVRGFDPSTRNLLDLGAVALLAHVQGLPVIVDPSHGAGRRDLIVPLSLAALAAGAAGLLLETHDDPGRALSDGPQALLPEQLAQLRSAP